MKVILIGETHSSEKRVTQFIENIKEKNVCVLTEESAIRAPRTQWIGYVREYKEFQKNKKKYYAYLEVKKSAKNATKFRRSRRKLPRNLRKRIIKLRKDSKILWKCAWMFDREREIIEQLVDNKNKVSVTPCDYRATENKEGDADSTRSILFRINEKYFTPTNDIIELYVVELGFLANIIKNKERANVVCLCGALHAWLLEILLNFCGIEYELNVIDELPKTKYIVGGETVLRASLKKLEKQEKSRKNAVKKLYGELNKAIQPKKKIEKRKR